MNAFWVILAIAFIVVMGPVLYLLLKAHGQSERIREALVNHQGLTVGDNLISPRIGIALDDAREVLGLALQPAKEVVVFVFPYSVITGVDLEIDDGSSFTRKSGFVSFSTETVIRSVNLVITLNDKAVPVIRLNLYAYAQDEATALSAMNQDAAVKTGRRWQALFNSIIRAHAVQKVVVQQVAGQPVLAPPTASSLSNEIAQLHQLHQAGALSKDEFDTAKTRLLSQ